MMRYLRVFFLNYAVESAVALGILGLSRIWLVLTVELVLFETLLGIVLLRRIFTAKRAAAAVISGNVASLLMTFVFALAVLLVPSASKADLGPKPELFIKLERGLTSEGADATLWQCETPSCVKSEMLKPYGPQAFHCCMKGCFARAYGFSPFLQLRLQAEQGPIENCRRR